MARGERGGGGGGDDGAIKRRSDKGVVKERYTVGTIGGGCAGS